MYIMQIEKNKMNSNKLKAIASLDSSHATGNKLFFNNIVQQIDSSPVLRWKSPSHLLTLVLPSGHFDPIQYLKQSL